jgi:hypothetical protein
MMGGIAMAQAREGCKRCQLFLLSGRRTANDIELRAGHKDNPPPSGEDFRDADPRNKISYAIALPFRGGMNMVASHLLIWVKLGFGLAGI